MTLTKGLLSGARPVANALTSATEGPGPDRHHPRSAGYRHPDRHRPRAQYQGSPPPRPADCDQGQHRCTAERNAGTGFQICPQFLTSRSSPISIHLDQCVSRGNQQHAIHLVSNPKDPPVGRLRITGFLAENDGMAGLSVQFNPFDAVRINLENSTFRNARSQSRSSHRSTCKVST